MSIVRMVCLANSWRPGGRCIAGIDLDTGEWVRPILSTGKAIPEGATKFGNHDLAPLDVIEVDLAPPDFSTRFQRENRVIQSKTWTFTGKRLSNANVLQYCATSSSVLHGHNKVVEPSSLSALQPSAWSSLELRHVTNARFSRDPRKENRWVVDFSTGSPFPTQLSLKVTDPLATATLNAGKAIGADCLLTLSLTEPIAYVQFNIPELCYKLAATVIEL